MVAVRQDHQIDPAKHAVWSVSMDVTFDMLVIAEDEDEACEVAEENAWEEMRNGVEAEAGFARRVKLPDPKTPPFAIKELKETLPWGPTFIGDREAKDALEILEFLQHGEAVEPEYDTLTALMPFVDSPPPLRDPERGS